MEIVPTEGQTERGVARYVIIVARDQPGLYEHLKLTFAADKKVEVILDRRQPDQRLADRRHLSEVDDQLRSLGWALTRRQDPASRG